MKPPFDDEDYDLRDDWWLAQNGAVNLFLRPEAFQDSVASLRALDYQIVDLDCSNMAAFLASVSLGFRWEEQFGGPLRTPSLDAINDGLGSAFGPSSRVAVCTERYDRLVRVDRKFALGFLDILEYQSRNALLFGTLILGLIQTADRRFETGKLGGRSAILRGLNTKDG